MKQYELDETFPHYRENTLISSARNPYIQSLPGAAFSSRIARAIRACVCPSITLRLKVVLYIFHKFPATSRPGEGLCISCLIRYVCLGKGSLGVMAYVALTSLDSTSRVGTASVSE